MSNEIKIKADKRSAVVKGKKKPLHAVYLRLCEWLHEATLESQKINNLSINSNLSLCVLLQHMNLPNFKVDRIEVFYTDKNGEQKREVHLGNADKKISNLHKKGE